MAVEPRHNLVDALTSFVGREREVAEVAERLASTRLLTLVGPGGIGKTRLALRVGAGLVPRYQGGVWLVELAPLADATTIPRAIASALGVYEDAVPPRAGDHRRCAPRSRLAAPDPGQLRAPGGRRRRHRRPAAPRLPGI